MVADCAKSFLILYFLARRCRCSQTFRSSILSTATATTMSLTYFPKTWTDCVSGMVMIYYWIEKQVLRLSTTTMGLIRLRAVAAHRQGHQGIFEARGKHRKKSSKARGGKLYQRLIIKRDQNQTDISCVCECWIFGRSKITRFGRWTVNALDTVPLLSQPSYIKHHHGQILFFSHPPSHLMASNK